MGPVMTKKVAGSFSRCISGNARVNWWREASSYVMDTAPFFPYCHWVMVVAAVWARDRLQDKQKTTMEVNSPRQARKCRFITKYN